MNIILENIAPFLSKTTAIMTAVILLTVIGAYLVSTERKINRQTVEKYILIIKKSIWALIGLEAFLTIIELVKYWLKLK